MNITLIKIFDGPNLVGCAHLEDENGDSRGVVPCRLAVLHGSRNRDENPESYRIAIVPRGNGDEFWIVVPK